MGHLWRALIALCIVVFCVGVSHADTGGRIGGGSWGGGGGGGGFSSSSSSSSSGWSSSSSSSSSSWSFGSSSSSYSSGGGGGGAELVLILVVCVIGGIGALIKHLGDSYGANPPPVDFSGFESSYRNVQNPGYTAGMASAYARNGVDVTVLRIAIDGRARKYVQTEMKRIAGTADTATAEGRAATLREVSLMLRRIKDAWVYGGAINEDMVAMESAKRTFDRHTDDARARFTEETVSNVAGKQGGAAASEYTPRMAEGAGVILVSIIVAARKYELYTVTSIGTGDDLKKALADVATRDPADLVAVEIIWQPSEDADRMSSMELEAKYPAPDLIKIKGALAGKTFCTYCGGPFPAELVTCPHCGAPAREPAST